MKAVYVRHLHLDFGGGGLAKKITPCSGQSSLLLFYVPVLLMAEAKLKKYRMRKIGHCTVLVILANHRRQNSCQTLIVWIQCLDRVGGGSAIAPHSQSFSLNLGSVHEIKLTLRRK